MEEKQNNILLNIAYYSLNALLLSISIIFMIYLGSADITKFEKITYYIISDLFVLLMIYDIICTFLPKMKFYSGLILYILTFLTILMAFILYGTKSTNGIIANESFNTFMSLVGFSIGINIIQIVNFGISEKIINYRNN